MLEKPNDEFTRLGLSSEVRGLEQAATRGVPRVVQKEDETQGFGKSRKRAR